MPKMFSVSSKLDVVGMLRGYVIALQIERIERTRPLELETKAFQPHSATEELDDLTAFFLADIHQAHRRHAPGAPAFSEFLRARQHSDRTALSLDVVKQGTGECEIFDDVMLVRSAPLRAQIAELLRVTDIHHAEPFVLTDPQPDLAFGPLQAHDVQLPAARSVENVLENIAK